MNLAYPTALAAVLVAAVAFGGMPGADGDKVAAASTDVETEYKLVVYGAEPSCSVTTGALVSDAKRSLKLGKACAKINPDLFGARYWIERSNGAIAFAEGDGDVLAEFAVADGAAFETFDPDAPMMVLLAAN